MTIKSTSTRAEQIRQRRTTQKTTTPAAPRISGSTRPTRRNTPAYLPAEPRRTTNSRPLRNSQGGKKAQATVGRGMGTVRKSTGRQRQRSYDVAFSLGHTDVRAPILTIPPLGSRWASGAMTLVLGFLLYTLWTASTFTVNAAVVSGNERLTAEDVYGQMSVSGEPIFKAVPAKIEQDLRTAFPDLASVKVHIRLPNRIIVDVVERNPLLAWYQDEAVTWVDAEGVAFMPRGEVQGLIAVAASAPPPVLTPAESDTVFAHVFLAPEMVQALVNLSPNVPAGVTMAYDPKYGAGWQDPRGWSVYFGQNIQEIPMKLSIYQSIVTTFIRQGIQPTIISVAYLDAPFYK
jgi:hypothetical protein